MKFNDTQFVQYYHAKIVYGANAQLIR